jgi:hypothetical protein
VNKEDFFGALAKFGLSDSIISIIGNSTPTLQELVDKSFQIKKSFRTSSWH